jgi:hypothetical protein
MSKECEICGKGVRAGRTIVRHGLQKKKGGIGLHPEDASWAFTERNQMPPFYPAPRQPAPLSRCFAAYVPRAFAPER